MFRYALLAYSSQIGRSKRCWQPVRSWGPQALRLAPDHIWGLVCNCQQIRLLNIQDSEGKGSERLLVQPFLLQMTELRPPKGQLCQSPLMLSPAFSIYLVSVRMAAPSEHRTYFPAGSHIFQWWHPEVAPVVFCLFWRDAAWLLLLLQHWVVCWWARSINNN